MHLSGFDRFTWATCLAGEILLLTVLFVRRRTAAFPVFTIYIAILIAKTLALYTIFSHYSYRIYEGWYWSLAFLDETAQLLVIYEIAVHIFRPTGVWARDVRKTFIALSCASIAVALFLACVAQPAASRTIQIFILRSNLFSAALMSELFVGMVVLSSTVGLPWRTHTARIAQGLGISSIAYVILDTITNFVGLNREHHTYTQLGRIGILTYLACETYWIVMLWAEAPAPRELPEAMRIQIYTLQRQVENDLIRLRSWRNN